MGRVLRAALSFAFAGALVAACDAPTLPLPPPLTPTATTAGVPTGQAVLTSTNGGYPHAIIVIYNPSPRVPDSERVGGAQADEMGSWSATIFASSGDNVEVWQSIGNDQSPYITVQIP